MRKLETCDSWFLNNSTCSITSNERTCKCQNGYKGNRCEISRCKSYCQNYASYCSINDLTGKPICNCANGFSGKKCEQALDCSKVSCLNGGEGFNSNALPVCKCKYGTFGDKYQFCNDRENNSTCQLVIDKSTQPSQRTCLCTSTRFNGRKCENYLCVNYCKNEGVCEVADSTNLKCKCPNSRFTGKQCEIDLCENLDCIRNSCVLSFSQTVKEFKCYCSNLCNSVYCNGNGKCEQSKCICYQGYSGGRCEFKVKGKSIEIDDELSEEDVDGKAETQSKGSKSLFYHSFYYCNIISSFICCYFKFYFEKGFYSNDSFNRDSLLMKLMSLI